MDIKIINTENEYEKVLERIDELMDAIPGTSQSEELELLSFLVEKYEEEHYPIDPPDPDAIKFRMDQQGLTAKDMIKYLGSQSKVSEVLNRKRPLSLTMIRNLHAGLGIPLDILVIIQDDRALDTTYSWKDFPFAEMVKRCYFPEYKDRLAEAKKQSEELLKNLFVVLSDYQQSKVYYRQLVHDFDASALKAWQARITQIALTEKLPTFSKKDLSEDLFRQVVKLSYFEDGPRLAKEFLNKKGIHLIFLSHLPKTYLDGACFYAADHRPLVGMTLRHDRLDNFWFTLIHELSHLYLHLNDLDVAFFDDTDNLLDNTNDPQEKNANEFAKEMLIAHDNWKKIEDHLREDHSNKVINFWANKLEINPAIIAGRVRWETKDFSQFTRLIGNNQVRARITEFDCF